MFDEPNKEPEDIFSGTEPQPQQPIQPLPTPNMNNGQPPAPIPLGENPAPAPMASQPEQEAPMMDMAGGKGKSNKGLIWVILLILAILILGAILMGIWMVRSSQNQIPEDNNTQPVVNNIVEEIEEPEIVTIEDEQEETTEPVDTDNDGLTDEEELELGTAVDNPDSDSDGLNDFEEIDVWDTNPLLNDTDGDGYTDGSEVDNGYDPTEPGGVLLDINSNQ